MVQQKKSWSKKLGKILQLNTFVIELFLIILSDYNELLKAKLFIDNNSFQHILGLNHELKNLPFCLEEPYYYFCQSVFSLSQDYTIINGLNKGAIQVYQDDVYGIFHLVNVFEGSDDGYTYLVLVGYTHNLFTIDHHLLPKSIIVGGASATSHYIVIQSQEKQRKLKFIEKFITGDDFEVFIYGTYSREVFDDPSPDWNKSLAINIT